MNGKIIFRWFNDLWVSRNQYLCKGENNLFFTGIFYNILIHLKGSLINIQYEVQQLTYISSVWILGISI